MCYNLLSCKVAFFLLWKFSQVAIFKLVLTLQFLNLEAYMYFNNSLSFIFFNSKILYFARGLFSKKCKNCWIFLLIRYLKKTRNCRGINKLPNAKKHQCSTFKTWTCETFLKITKILSFSKKTQKLCILRKKTVIENLFFTFYVSESNFRALGPTYFFKSIWYTSSYR